MSRGLFLLLVVWQPPVLVDIFQFVYFCSSLLISVRRCRLLLLGTAYFDSKFERELEHAPLLCDL
jgi:hypothetical protein